MSTEPDGGTPEAPHQWWWRSAALLVFCLALVTPFHEVWQGNLTEVVPLFPRFEGELTRELQFTKTGYGIDTRFHAFGVVRNARALLSDPLGFYDTEQCFPSTGTLALGEPMITLGILAVPAYLLTGDPIATYNLVLVLSVLLSAIGMYLLVTEWSALPAAGIVAGLLYAFHPVKINDVAHPFINDTVWTVLALLFARRFFARGRWFDAIAAALCASLQIAGSYYPFLAATLLALPMLVWLFMRYGVRELRVAPCLCAAAIMLVTGLAVFAPYLELHSSLGLPERSYQAFETWQSLLPGGARFPGWVFLGLVAAGLGLRRRDALGGLEGDPRWALSIGCLLIAATAVGHFQPSPLPNLYAALASFVPGMSSVRRPGELMSGVHLTLSVLSGLGAAALLRRTPRVPGRYLAVALIVVTYLATLRPGSLGLESPVVYSALEVRPSDEQIAFFRRLEELGNSGPLLEVPMPLRRFYRSRRSSEQALLTLYHHRQTSGCYASYIPSKTSEVTELGRKIPDRDALERLREMGFTTIVVHRQQLRTLGPRLVKRLDKAASRSTPLLRRLHASESLVAYELVALP